MKLRASLISLFAGCLLVMSSMALAQQTAVVEIAGQVEQPASYTLEALAALPPVSVQAPREGGGTVIYAGPLLWPFLETARLTDGPAKGAHLQHVLFGRGADGYAAALAIGELDPQFEGKTVIIATQRDGVRLEHPRLVVPGDHRLGRSVRDLVAIEVR